MFRKLFGKTAPATSGVKEARSQWGSAFHLIDADQWADLSEGVTLCGNSSWTRAASDADVVLEEVVELSEKKFDSWHYCATCVEVVKGKLAVA